MLFAFKETSDYNKQIIHTTDLYAVKRRIKMKKLLLTIVFVLGGLVLTYAQKYAYVDTDYILENIPEYADAQDELNEISVVWQKEIEEKFAEIDKLYKSYQADAVLLPEDMKRKREEEIIKKEKEAKDLQKKRFGQDGDLFKKRQELVKPIQDKIFNAIEEIAKFKNYAFVFDKSSGPTVLYADSKYDISDEVLRKVGSVIKSVEEGAKERGYIPKVKIDGEDVGGDK